MSAAAGVARQIRKIEEPGRPVRTLFSMTGAEGAVTFEVFGDPPMGGPIEIHYPGGPNECEFTAGGTCRADQAFRAGAETYEHYAADRPGDVFAEMARWYDSRLRPWVEAGGDVDWATEAAESLRTDRIVREVEGDEIGC